MDHPDNQHNTHDYISDLPPISGFTYADLAALGGTTSAESGATMNPGNQSQQVGQGHNPDEHAHSYLGGASSGYQNVDPQGTDNAQGDRGMVHSSSVLDQRHTIDTKPRDTFAQAANYFDSNMTVEDDHLKDSPNSTSGGNLDYIPMFKSDGSPVALGGKLQVSTPTASQKNHLENMFMGPSREHLLSPPTHGITAQGRLSYANTTMVASDGSGLFSHTLMGQHPSSQFFTAPVHINHNVNHISAAMSPVTTSAVPVTSAVVVQGLGSINPPGPLGAPFLPQLSAAAPTNIDQPNVEATAEQAPREEEVVLKFSSVEEANDYRPDREGPLPSDSTIPVTTDQKKAIVIQMLRAMRSVQYAQDNIGMIKPFREGKHSMERMEIVCWNILDACIIRHQVGPLLTPEEEKLKNKNPTVIRSFRERLDHMLDCLRTQKTICKHLLDPFYLFQFVDDPPFAKYRVTSNKSLNKKKSDYIIAGKKVLGHPKGTRRGKKGPQKNIPSLSAPFNTPKREPHTANNEGPTMGSTMGPAFVPANTSAVTQTPYEQLAEMHIRQGRSQPRQVPDTPMSYAFTHLRVPHHQTYLEATPNTNAMRRSPLNRLSHLSGSFHSQQASPVIGTPEFPTPPGSGPSRFAHLANSTETLPQRKRSSESAECPEPHVAGQKKPRST